MAYSRSMNFNLTYSWWECYERGYFLDFWRKSNNLWNELLKRPFRNSEVNSLTAEIRTDPLALSGPAFSLCPLETGVKDIDVDNFTKLQNWLSSSLPFGKISFAVWVYVS